jgi:hypothetical protein
MSSARKEARMEVLEAVRPLIDRISACLVGHNVGVAAYALINLAVTCWRKTGLPDEGLHGVVDEVLQAANAVAAENAGRKN